MPTRNFKNSISNLKERLKSNPNISEDNKELILKYMRDLKLSDYSYARVNKLGSHMKRITEDNDIDLEEASKEDIKDILEWIHDNPKFKSSETIKDYKVALRVFYKWLVNGDPKSNEYPSIISWVNTSGGRNNSKIDLPNPRELLNEDDIIRMVKATNHKRDAAFISLAWEAGARAGEIIDLKVTDISWNDTEGYEIILDGKTGKRRINLYLSEPYMSQWINEHPLKLNGSDRWPDVPLWTKVQAQSHNGNEEYGRVTYDSIRKMLIRTKEKAGINKKVTLTRFRHSRATDLAKKGFTSSQLCSWLGWVQSSDMPQVYIHLAGRDVDDAYKEIHGIEEKSEDEDEPKSKMVPKSCIRCGYDNVPASALVCPNCNTVFEEGRNDMEETFELINKLRKLDEETIKKIKILDENPDSLD